MAAQRAAVRRAETALTDLQTGRAPVVNDPSSVRVETIEPSGTSGSHWVRVTAIARDSRGVAQEASLVGLIASPTTQPVGK